MLATRRLAIAILFLGLFAMAVRISMGADTWWHLRAGQWMVDNGALLSVDVFSYPLVGTQWINHSWLSQIPLFLAWDAFGYAGLNLVVALVVVATFVMVYRTCRGGPYLRAFVVLLAAATSSVYWSARPQLASLLLAATFSFVLYQFRRADKNHLWLLPLLMLLWVNLHGGFAIGFILLLTTALGEALKFGTALVMPAPTPAADKESVSSRTDRWLLALAHSLHIPAYAHEEARRSAWLVGIGLACALLVPLNPYGPRMLLYPFETVSIGVLQDFIQEWQSPNFHIASNQLFLVMVFSTLAAVGFSRRRLDVTDFLIFSVFAYLGFLAGRNIAIFAIVAAPVLATHLDNLVDRLQTNFLALRIEPTAPTPLQARLNWVLLLLVVFAVGVKIISPLTNASNEAGVADFQPVKAVTYLRQTSPSGNLFNSYNWGGYLIWSLYPDMPVFIDGRTDLYADEFLRAYLDTAFARPGWQATLNQYEIDIVLIETGSTLAGVLSAEPGWRVDYSDEIATIFLRAAA